MIEQLTHERFVPLMHTYFQVLRQDGEIPLQLVEVSEVQSSGGSETFSVVFRGPSAAPLPQATYQFRQDNASALDLFIVPIGVDKDGVRYEAVFNSLTQEHAV